MTNLEQKIRILLKQNSNPYHVGITSSVCGITNKCKIDNQVIIMLVD